MESKQEIEELVAEVIFSSNKWSFNLKEALPLAQKIVRALEKAGAISTQHDLFPIGRV